MRAKSWIVAAVIMVALVGCGFGVYKIADSLARDSIQATAKSTLEKQLRDKLGTDANVEVTLGDGSVLTDLGSGELKDVNAKVTVGYDAILKQLHDRGGVMVETVTGSGDTLSLGAKAGIGGIEVPVNASVKLVPEGQTIKAQLVGLEAAGQPLPAKKLPKALRTQLQDVPVPIPTLPAGIAITSVNGTDSGLSVHLHADSITMDDLRKVI